jgi:hypothetical protein
LLQAHSIKSGLVPGLVDTSASTTTCIFVSFVCQLIHELRVMYRKPGYAELSTYIGKRDYGVGSRNDVFVWILEISFGSS